MIFKEPAGKAQRPSNQLLTSAIEQCVVPKQGLQRVKPHNRRCENPENVERARTPEFAELCLENVVLICKLFKPRVAAKGWSGLG